jgi:DNA-binding MarR family transcriptional regulator
MARQHQPRWLDPQEMAFWMAFLRGQKRLEEALDLDLRERVGIEIDDYEVLSVLSEQPDHRLRMSALADTVIMARSRLTYRVDRLVEAGLVRREACPGDRRGQFACLTDEGWQLVKTAAPVHLASVRHHLVDRLRGVDLGALTAAFEAAGTEPLHT